VEDEGANWSSDDLGRSSDDGKDPIPLLVIGKYNPSTVLQSSKYWSAVCSFLLKSLL